MDEVNWIRILGILAEGEGFGHESWFEVGLEQHKQFYYCLLGDCSVSEESKKLVRDGKQPSPSHSENFFWARHKFSLEYAIKEALFRWLQFVVPEKEQWNLKRYSLNE